MTEREASIIEFLTRHGWGDAVRAPITGDASARRYERLNRADGDIKKAVLLDGAPALEGQTCPVGADEATRNDLGYTAQARLAGTNPEAFVCLATDLWRRGFAAPKVLAADLDLGLIILEDLGSALLADVLQENPERELSLYTAAVDCLADLYRSSFGHDLRCTGVVAQGASEIWTASWHVGAYDDLALQTEADLLLEWYIPEYENTIPEEGLEKWKALWSEAFSHLQHCASGLGLRDYHAENIFALSRDGKGEEEARIGLIDFQDALFVHPAYDLVSLLEDARRDVSADMVEPLKAHFCAQAGLTYDADFKRAYAVLGAQRNAKILGIFVRLARRDGKEKYLSLLPRVAAHFIQDLEHPDLSDLQEWFSIYAPSVFELGRDRANQKQFGIHD